MGGNGRASVTIRIRRQDGPDTLPRWEEFRIAYRPSLNVITVLRDIQRNPVTIEGRSTTPPAWESNCLEEVCGACSIVINGRARQACSALVDSLPDPIVLEPMRTFPVVRDLVVDRSRMFDALKRVRAWIPIDGTYALGPGPRVSSEAQEIAYKLSTCMTCGVCLEVCPQVTPASAFIGPAALSQVRLFNMHPTGSMRKSDRLRAIMGSGGLADCGNSQNCVKACPKEIPLTTSIAVLNREATILAIRDFLKG
jgi:succinate dehydrogenase / fumarate reductase iron-sulfur subunit